MSKGKKAAGASEAAPPRAVDFIRARIRTEVDAGQHGRVATRFPPEPNGYLHLGHAKSICLNFGIAREFGGVCNLRFDDTNPLKEDPEFVQSIQDDIRWLGFDWDGLFFASDYFETIYRCAERLIEKGLAYVDGQNEEQIRATRGTLTQPGTNSPDRDRSIDDNLELFRKMRMGQFPDGLYVLRAKIDMASPNINLRDPAIYRIRHAEHHHTGDAWCVYPLYDFTHCISDAIEGITHSICTLEFEDHRPLYDWFLDNLDEPFASRPVQIEFSRGEVEYMVMSKRFYTRLIGEGRLDGWDDPRNPTLAGLRRRGYTAAAIRDFCERVGVTKQPNTVELALLEYCVRLDLEPSTPRGMAVLDPLPVLIENYPANSETLRAPWHPKDAALGDRTFSFSSELFIEREDFEETAPPGWKRLSLGGEVRLRYGYILRCDRVERGPDGAITRLICHYFPDSKSGSDTSGRKPAGVIHWVDAHTSVAAEVRLYGTLFVDRVPDSENLDAALNPDSLRVITARLEPAMAQCAAGPRYQFERQGYFIADSRDSRAAAPVFNRTVTLRDSYKPG